MVIIIALIFGVQVEKINAFYYFFFYNLIRFLPFLIIMMFFLKYLIIINIIYMDFFVRFFIIFFSLLVFLVKFPLFFFHYWLPKIHVEASTFSRILLASLLLKFGVYGFYRFIIFLKIINIIFFFYLFFFGIIVCLFLCLIQRDIKSQIAFSSITHIRIVFFNLIIFSLLSEKIAFFVIIGHAFRSSLRFWFVGEVFYSINRRLIIEVNSFFLRNFIFFIFFLFILILIGSFPFSLNYFTEFYIFFLINKSLYFILGFCLFFFFDLFLVIFLFGLLFLGKFYKSSKNIFFPSLIIFFLWSYNFFFF